jgi:hypothetical protein
VENFFKANTVTPDTFSHTITDIDANGQDRDSVCVLGGFIGEFLMTMTIIEEFAMKEEYAEAMGLLLEWKYANY